MKHLLLSFVFLAISQASYAGMPAKESAGQCPASKCISEGGMFNTDSGTCKSLTPANAHIVLGPKGRITK